jgi:hypothetical protein
MCQGSPAGAFCECVPIPCERSPYVQGLDRADLRWSVPGHGPDLHLRPGSQRVPL